MAEAPKHASFSSYVSDWKQQSENGLRPKDIVDPQLRQEFVESTARRAAADRKVPFSKRTAQQWENLSTGHKVNAGISGACAVMAAFSTVSAVSRVMARDEEGKAHIQWSNVGVALLEATIAAGCAFFTVEALHGRSPF